VTLFTQDDLAVLSGVDVSSERYGAVYRAVIGLVREAYGSDPEATTGDARQVITSISVAVALRVLANPLGARSMGLGAANVVFAGNDSTVGSVGLTSEERRSLRRLRSPGGSIVSVPILTYGEELI
jgi:hypothetical protein